MKAAICAAVWLKEGLYGRCEFGYVEGFAVGTDGTDALHQLLGALIGVDFVEADFHNVVGADIDAGGFEVEEDDGFF